ncbi:MAG: response regulator [Planctomycetaceae bacterium]|jgi:CheY-like chemotaxis protein/signal transduction histidine kinase|nr:response regulator [Planctomycetaceae bacterium]
MSPSLLAFKTAQIFQYWDIGIIITVAVILMAAFTAWMIRLRVKPSYTALVWIPFFIIIFTGYSHIISEEQANSKLWVNNLETTAKVLAAATESLGHAQLTDLTDENQKKIYQHLLDLQTKWCDDIPFIAYIYTLRRIPGTVNKCCWVISCPADVNKDNKFDGHNESGEDFGSPYDEWFDVYQKGFDGETAIDENVHSPQYGDFVTVVVPLHDLRIPDREHPYTEAILGIDVFKSDWNRIAERLHAVLLQTFIIHLLLYAAVVATVSVIVVNLQKLKKAAAGTLAAQMRAEHLTQAKSNFMSVMNKEITTPLEAVVGFTNVLTQRVAQNCSREMKEETEGLFEIINKNSQDLTLAVNNIMDYAKIEANMLQVEMVPMSLKSVIDDVCRVVKPDIAAKNLGFGVNFRNDIPSLILSDPVRMRQILTSIINHAVDLTERGAVQIHCSTKPPTTDFEAAVGEPVSTSDKTPSIIAMDSKHLFAALTMLQIDVVAGGAPLSQIQSKSKIENNDAAMPDNSVPLYDEGFGLNFGKRIASLLDGAVLVSPVGHNGMMFSLLLNVFIPKDKQSAVQSVLEFQSYLPQGSQLEPGLAIRDPARLEGIESEKEGQSLKHTRVLVVDDVVTNQMVVSAQLRYAGAIVDVSENGDAAVKKINENIDNGIFYDIILMDTQMPVMDGFQAAAVLREQEYRVPIILMTAHALMGDKEKCAAAGCNGYISKPVNKDELLNMIMKHWNRSH